MPEGDTVRKVANALLEQLLDKPLSRLWLYDRSELPWLAGTKISAIETRGKHMLTTFSGHEDGDWVLRVHLGLKGYWRWYREPRDPFREARVVLSTDHITYICFDPAQVELCRANTIRTHPKLRRLGPDLISEDVDYDEILRRARSTQQRGREIGEVMLDQNVAAGIGNVYRSEVLFIQRMDPRRSVDEVTNDELQEIYAEASRLLILNVGLRSRETVQTRRGGGPDLYVYGRSSERCLRCKTKVLFTRTGDLARPLYYCPSCQ